MNKKTSRLTGKQARFVDEYLIDLNSAGAYRRAGYKAKNDNVAGVEGFKSLKNPKIAAYIEKRMADRLKRTEITQDDVLLELGKLGFSDIRKALKWGSKLSLPDPDTGQPVIVSGVQAIDSNEIDDDTAAAIAEVVKTRDGIKLKMHDKRAALVDIGRHLGMFKDKVEVSGKNQVAIEAKTPVVQLDFDAVMGSV